MKVESIVFAVAGMLFGVILGWVIGAQQAARPAAAQVALAPAPAAAPGGRASGSGTPRQPPSLDEGRVQALLTIVKNDPRNVGAQVQLGDVYFDAERYDEAIAWYERALKLDPKNVDASTDLGVSYYYTNRADRALDQFAYSLKLDPRHTKTLLNQGVVLAFGKQNLEGASEAWRKVVELAPNSPEGQAARRALEGVAAAHPEGDTGTPTAPPGG